MLLSVYEYYFVIHAYVQELVSEKPTRGMLVKSPLYGDVSEKPMMGMIYPSSAGTLTRVKTLETCVESAFATVYVQSAIAGCFPLFW